MKKFYLLTAFGKDRPGMVAGVTGALLDVGANVEDASMTRLGGEFTMMLVTALPSPSKAAQLQKRLLPLKKKLGLDILIKPVATALARQTKTAATTYMISVYGTDKPGIVYQVTQALAVRNVSVTDLNTKVLPRGRSNVYVMFLEIQVTPAVDLDDLRSELDRLRTVLDVEITLQDIDAVAL